MGKELSEKAEDRRAESAHENAPEAAPKALSVSLVVFNVNFVVFFFYWKAEVTDLSFCVCEYVSLITDKR